MADPFATGLRALFRGPRSVAAVYRPAAGGEISLRVIKGGGSRDVAYGQGTVRLAANMVQIQCADVDAAIDDQIDLPDGTFRISAEPERDAQDLTVTCEIEPA